MSYCWSQDYFITRHFIRKNSFGAGCWRNKVSCGEEASSNLWGNGSWAWRGSLLSSSVFYPWWRLTLVWLKISFAIFFSMRPWNGRSFSGSGLMIIDLHQFLWKWLWKFLDIFDSGSAVYVTRCLFLQCVTEFTVCDYLMLRNLVITPFVDCLFLEILLVFTTLEIPLWSFILDLTAKYLFTGSDCGSDWVPSST